MSYKVKDHYFKKAKEENFAARSVYKLEEIDQKFKIVKPGQLVLDLGASPGSWSQYVSKKIGEKGRVLGIDLQPVTVHLKNAVFIQADILDASLENIMRAHGINPPFDLVLSDMAPKTTGIKITDQMRSLELCEMALRVAEKHLKPGGHFVCKLFHSDDFKSLKAQILAVFSRFEAIRPKSTRQQSKEIFLVGLNKKT